MIDYIVKYPTEMAPTLAVILPILAILFRVAYRQRAIRFLFVYMLAKFTIDIFMWVAASNRQPNLYLENIEWIIRFYLLARMFYDLFELSFSKAVVIYGAIIYTLVLGIDIIDHDFYHSLSYIGLAECIVMLALCCLYLFETMTLLRIHWLPGHSPFYVVAALLFYYAGTLFLRPMAPYLNQHPYNLQMQEVYLLAYTVESLSWGIVSLGFFVSKS